MKQKMRTGGSGARASAQIMDMAGGNVPGSGMPSAMGMNPMMMNMMGMNPMMMNMMGMNPMMAQAMMAQVRTQTVLALGADIVHDLTFALSEKCEHRAEPSQIYLDLISSVSAATACAASLA